MSTKLLPLLECPFCPDHTGAIILDASALADARATWAAGSSLAINDRPDQQIFVFNSNRADPGPREHLVQFYGDCFWGPIRDDGRLRDEWALEFEWWFKQIDPDERMTDALYLALDVAGVPALAPQTSLFEERYSTAWNDYAVSDGPECVYTVGGAAIFTEDGKRLFEELLQLEANDVWVEEVLAHVNRKARGGPEYVKVEDFKCPPRRLEDQDARKPVSRRPTAKRIPPRGRL